MGQSPVLPVQSKIIPKPLVLLPDALHFLFNKLLSWVSKLLVYFLSLINWIIVSAALHISPGIFLTLLIAAGFGGFERGELLHQTTPIPTELTIILTSRWPDHCDTISASSVRAQMWAMNWGGVKKEKLRGVCSLHRRDAYPNTSTNSWDGDLVVQPSVGTKTVWAPDPDSSPFYLSDSGAASRGNPCLK